MTHEEKRRVYEALTAPFDGDAIERTEGRITGRGYNTTGIKYAYVVARLNEALGIGGFRTLQSTTVREGSTAKGRAEFQGTCELDMQLGEWMDGTFKPFAEAHATGGHQSVNEADARKGAYTNAFKKAASMFGCGQQAYMGTLDDDNVQPAAETRTYKPAESRTYKLSPVVRPDDPVVRPAAPTAASPVRQSAPPQAAARIQTQPNATVKPAIPAPTVVSATSNEPSPSVETQQSGSTRNRLTSKQLAALWALSRKVGYEQTTFRRKVHERHGVQPEYLDRDSASTLIGQLSAMVPPQGGLGPNHTAANGAAYQ